MIVPFSIFLCALTFRTSQAGGWNPGFAVLVQNSDVVAVVRLENYLGMRETRWQDQQGKLYEDADSPVFLHDCQFTTRLNLGNERPNSMLVAVSGHRPGLYSTAPWASAVPWALGETGFILARKPTASARGVLMSASRNSDYRYIGLQGDETYSLVNPGQFPKLPVANYAVEGVTNVQRTLSVFAQAYELNPDANQRYLDWIYTTIPTWHKDRTTGEIIVDEAGFSDPTICRFVQEKIVPRLMRAAGTDPVKQLRALYFACIGGNPDREPEYQQKLAELESNYDKPDEQNLILGICSRYHNPGREYWLQKIRSRLSTVRKWAIGGLKTSRENIQPLLALFEGENSWEVVERIGEWFRSMKSDHRKEYQDAPNPVLDRVQRVVTNKAEVVAYWSGKN